MRINTTSVGVSQTIWDARCTVFSGKGATRQTTLFRAESPSNGDWLSAETSNGNNCPTVPRTPVQRQAIQPSAVRERSFFRKIGTCPTPRRLLLARRSLLGRAEGWQGPRGVYHPEITAKYS